MDRGGRRAEHLEREFMGNSMEGGRYGGGGNGMGGTRGSGGGYSEEIGMREAMMEADQRMEWKRREEMEIEREAARFNNGGNDTEVTFGGGRGRGGGGRRGSFDQGQYRGGGGRRGSFDDQGDNMEMGFNNGRRAYDGGFGGNQMGGGMMGGSRGGMETMEDMMGQQFRRGMGGGPSLPPAHPSIGGGVRGSDGLVRSTAGVMGKACGIGDGRFGEPGNGMGMGGPNRGGMGMGRPMRGGMGNGGPLEMIMGGDDMGGNFMGGGRQGQDMDFRGKGGDGR